jgi:hypothetical protein
MTREELQEREYKDLDSIAKNYLQHVEVILGEIRKERIKLWMQKPDMYRLLTLRTWETKYRIDTRTLLQTLLPFWERFVQRRSKKMKKAGLNVRVSTLTGKKSEQVLKDQLKVMYPSQENVMLYISNERERIIQNYLKRLEKKGDDGVRSRSDPSGMYADNGKPKTLLDFSTPDAFMKYYRKWIRKEQLAREEVETELKKYAFRGNPFRQELL